MARKSTLFVVLLFALAPVLSFGHFLHSSHHVHKQNKLGFQGSSLETPLEGRSRRQASCSQNSIFIDRCLPQISATYFTVFCQGVYDSARCELIDTVNNVFQCCSVFSGYCLNCAYLGQGQNVPSPSPPSPPPSPPSPPPSPPSPPSPSPPSRSSPSSPSPPSPSSPSQLPTVSPEQTRPTGASVEFERNNAFGEQNHGYSSYNAKVMGALVVSVVYFLFALRWLYLHRKDAIKQWPLNREVFRRSVKLFAGLTLAPLLVLQNSLVEYLVFHEDSPLANCNQASDLGSSYDCFWLNDEGTPPYATCSIEEIFADGRRDHPKLICFQLMDFSISDLLDALGIAYGTVELLAWGATCTASFLRGIDKYKDDEEFLNGETCTSERRCNNVARFMVFIGLLIGALVLFIVPVVEDDLSVSALDLAVWYVMGFLCIWTAVQMRGLAWCLFRCRTNDNRPSTPDCRGPDREPSTTEV
eukprot:m.51066 g.51066  ORF g.51066 m.51066 type:complete len:471 (+) comp10709_c0_seq1:91-1503(+)